MYIAEREKEALLCVDSLPKYLQKELDQAEARIQKFNLDLPYAWESLLLLLRELELECTRVEP